MEANKNNKRSVIDTTVLNSIRIEQHTLFEGYMRNEVKPIDVYMDIPLDLINLCYKFFEINIYYLLSDKTNNKNKTEIDVNILHKLAGSLYDSYEFYISYLILYILINKYDLSIPKYHNLLAMVLQDWGSSSIEASKEFEIAISLKPHSHIYKWNYGILLIDQEKYKLALKQFIDASNLDPNEPEYCKKIAYIYQLLKDHQNASKYYLKCIELKKNISKYYLIYARYLNEEIENYIESEKFYKLSIQIEEENKNTNTIYDYYIEYAELLKKFGTNESYKNISEIYEKCINECMKNKSKNNMNDITKYYYLYARLFRDDYKNYIKSEIYYKKCLEINDTYDGLNGSYGHLLYLMGRYNESKKYLQIAYKLDEKNIWTYYYYGLLMKQLKNINEAKNSLQKSLNMFKINCQSNYSNAIILKENMIPHLRKTKAVDNDKNVEFHMEFENLINEYIDTLHKKIETK